MKVCQRQRGDNHQNNLHGNPEVEQKHEPQHEVHLKRAYIHRALNASTSGTWFVDSSASDHLCFDVFIFNDLVSLPKPIKIYIGDNRFVLATGRGRVNLPTLNLHTVYYVPDLGSNNLISVGQRMKDGFSVNFSNSACTIKARGAAKGGKEAQETIVPYSNGLFELSLSSVKTLLSHIESKPLPLKT